MKKGEQTHIHIAEKAARLFNMRGYFGTSMSDLLEATGLQKGGLYNHFASKEALALAAFDFALDKFRQRYAEAAQGQTSALACLRAISAVMLRNYADPVVEGGCIVFNTALEADDAQPALKARAQAAMRDLLRFIALQVRRGQRNGEISADVDPQSVATILISIYEGALGLSKLFGDPTHIQRAQAHMMAYLDTLTAETKHD